MFKRLLIRKRPAFRNCPVSISTLKAQLQLPGLKSIETIALYDLFDAPEALLPIAIERVFADSVSDDVIDELPAAEHTLVIEPLPGQFDQRADSAEQCLQLIDKAFADTTVRSAVAWLIHGELSDAELNRLKAYLINPIESREKDLAQTRLPEANVPQDVPVYTDFLALDEAGLAAFHQRVGLAMTLADLALIQSYFKKENRAPTETEIRVLDTYWSDHCRHTTFATQLNHLSFPKSALGDAIKGDYEDFITKRQHVYGNEIAAQRPLTLMELATIDAKYQRKAGNLDDVEFSAEVNACSVFVDVSEQQQSKKWLLQFKNETHNHPTEIEPFGGASTCIGGAIRDPLSGRAYVYQALRISGSADPREAIADTLPGKLPQRVIAERSAAGNSSYGNQIGLATGQVVELYHAGYKAKHMEVGAVVAATPADHVRREEPQAGDVVLLLGGATGRDGCGGATGSSKEQNTESLTESAAEVQKGNAPEERKLQRLFKQGAFAKLIKRCNDFGAGGVSVAIGELADGLDINLDTVPVKYQGLNGTELAISESQERMAIVVAAKDMGEAQALAAAENLTATHIATVTADATLTMHWRGKTIVSLSRAFLDTNGAPSLQNGVAIHDAPAPKAKTSQDWRADLKAQLSELRFADQRGLGDRFDFNVGAACVLLPYGGSTQRTPTEASVYLLPTETTANTASILAYGFNPDISAVNPYIGAMLAVLESSARLVAAGGDIRRAHFSLQEYFPKLGADASRWGLPFTALLGAHHALAALSRAAIGGKDSMSGSFNDLDVPPTLISFAVTTIDKKQALSPEFKQAGDYVYLLNCAQDDLGRPDFAAFLENNRRINTWNREGKLASVRSIRQGGVIQALYEAALGNDIGVEMAHLEAPFAELYGAFLVSSRAPLPEVDGMTLLGKTTKTPTLAIAGEHISIEELSAYTHGLKEIYPLNKPSTGNAHLIPSKPQHSPAKAVLTIAQPRVCIPVFPGSNSEFDTAYAFERAGALSEQVVIRNRHQEDIESSLNELITSLKKSQIFTLVGGFSAGDEPDGSGKFIANILANPRVAEAIADFLARDGLILGICNGFQALIKSGLLTNGKVHTPQPSDATLTHNTIHRHIARIVSTRVVNNHSPWLADFALGEIHDVAISHGEGRFFVNEATLAELIAKGQIATQYVNPITGEPSMAPEINPNGSVNAIESMTSPDGRIFGKMGHSERYQAGIYRNHPNFRPQNIFAAGVRAFK